MRHHLRLGASFLALAAEFSSPKVVRIRAQANLEIKKALEFERDGARASRVAFEAFEYGFLALRTSKTEWTLEVAGTPPHAEPGKRISSARRKREREERKHAERATLKRLLIFAASCAERILFKSYRLFRKTCLNLSALRQQIQTAGTALRFTLREQLLRMTSLSREFHQPTPVAAWPETASASMARGLRLEGRLFGGDIGLPMWLNTLSPIGVVFVLGGVSIFGERALESEWVT
jgi:hypothetical protein